MIHIDANKLHDDLTKMRIKLMQEEVDVAPTWQVLDCVRQQPTADVRENVKGKWEDVDTTSGYKRCSVCSHIFNDIVLYKANGRTTVITHDIPFQFCPNCGADMRGGDAK